MHQALFYKAKTTGNMWDTWLFWHEGTHYLFHLSGQGGAWHGISMATSKDAVHWSEHGLVIEKDEDASWLGTGSTWRIPVSEGPPHFMMNFSQWKGAGQSIFFAESNDLLHWRRTAAEFKPDGRWYETAGGNEGRWDSINVLAKPAGEGFYGWWTANPIGVPGLGFGESADGVTWTALPPPQFEWGDIPPIKGIEQGAIAEIGGKFYSLLGQGSAYWFYGSGMFTFVADNITGPFRPASVNYALLTSPPDRGNAYFTRFYPLGDTLLVNHHSIAPVPPVYEVYLAPLKLVEVDAHGVLRLKWWPGNSEAIRDWKRSAPRAIAEDVEITYDPSVGMVIEASTRITDGNILSRSAISLGCGDSPGITRLTIHSDATLEVELLTPGAEARVLERIDRSLELAGPVSVRVLVMHDFVELYLNDYLLTVQSLHPWARGILTLSGPVFISCLTPMASD